MGQIESHRAVLDRPEPANQHAWAPKNETAYKWFYVSMGFAGVVLCLVIFTWCYLNRKNSKKNDEEDPVQNSFLRNSIGERKTFEPSLTTAKVQPESSDVSYETDSFSYPASGKGMNFGSYANVPQQPPISHYHIPQQNLEMQNEHLMETLDQKSGRSNSNNDTGSGPGSLNKMDSIDMYLNDPGKTPLQQRLEAQNGFSSYLHITPSELSRLNSLPEDMSDMSTLPLSK